QHGRGRQGSGGADAGAARQRHAARQPARDGDLGVPDPLSRPAGTLGCGAGAGGGEMTRRHLSLLFLAPFVLLGVEAPPVEAAGMMRIQRSLMNESEHAAPLIPEFGYKKKQREQQKQLQKKKKKKKAKKVDPMKVIRTRMIAGKK